MSVNSDGSANCDRCGTRLPGFGVLYGIVCSHLVNGAIEDLIFCYVNGCRDAVLVGLSEFTVSSREYPVWCSDDGTELRARAVDVAMLLTDLDPRGTGAARYLQLCYEHGSRDRLLVNAGRTP